MVAFGAAGFVLWLNPTLLDDLRDAITAAVPGPLSDAVIPFIDEAVAQRNAVAGLGLLAAAVVGDLVDLEPARGRLGAVGAARDPADVRGPLLARPAGASWSSG